ncbi:MAG: hypothetical protein AAGE52_15010 [Myxococcota bacterium]
MRTIFRWAFIIGVGACGGEEPAPQVEASGEPQAAQFEELVERLQAESAQPAKSRAAGFIERARREREEAERRSVEGTMSFQIDDERRTVTHFPEPDNVLTTRTLAVKGVEGEESLSVVIANFSVADTSFPVDVRGNLSEAMRQGRAPRTIAVQYRRGDVQYGAQGTVHIESYTDGFLVGGIEEVQLFGAGDSQGQRATLRDLQFRIRVGVNELAGPILEAISGGR